MESFKQTPKKPEIQQPKDFLYVQSLFDWIKSNEKSIDKVVVREAKLERQTLSKSEKDETLYEVWINTNNDFNDELYIRQFSLATELIKGDESSEYNVQYWLSIPGDAYEEDTVAFDTSRRYNAFNKMIEDEDTELTPDEFNKIKSEIAVINAKKSRV